MDDNMQNPKPKIDVKENLINVLTIISETKGIYKQKDLVSILLGKNNALLASHNIVDNKYFGSGKSKNEQFWNGLLWYLRAEGMVHKKVENFGSLAINEKGLKYLNNPKELLISINENNSATEKVHKINISQSGDIVLMNKLKELRKKIADDKSIPPYVIFQDPSLNEMTFRYPISTDELSSIFGVGEGKAKKYGKDFIELIAKHVDENNIDRPDEMVVKSAGKNSSLKLFIIQGIDRKFSVEDIAQSKSMQVEELISEMETIVYSGTKLDLSYCIDDYLDEDQQDELYDYFIESESDDIEQALTEFDGEYDEFELKLFRIKFLSDLAN
jgi:ATP-dependent DNA helicase RecQ